jgi:Putative adhesin
MSEIIEKTFTVASQARLDLSNIRGSVEVRAGEEGVIRVRVTKDANSGDASRTEIELSQATDGSVKVATHFPEGVLSWLFGSFPCRVDYVVQAPRKCSLKINGVSSETLAEGFEGEFSFHSVSGGMTLRSLSGPVKVNTVSGGVELADLAGDLNLTTVSGKVSGKHIQGPVHLNTVSGQVALDESSLSSVDASTVSARMEYQTAFGTGPYRFNSVSGDVELLVPPETRCSAELHAISGKLFSKLPATSISRQNGNQTAEIQGGGVRVHLHSVSGNLSLVA